MPGNVIVFPGMKCCGSLIHSSRVSPFQDAGGFERGGVAREAGQDPDFRFHNSAKLGPVMLRLGSSEWQATQARYRRSPFDVLPTSAVARYESAGSKSTAVATDWMRFIVDLHWSG